MLIRDVGSNTWESVHALADHQPETALERARQLADEAREQQRTGLEARFLLTIATAELLRGAHDASREALERSLELLAQSPDEVAVAAEAHLLAVRLRFMASDHESALRHGHRAAELADTAGDPALRSRALNTLGLVYGHMGAYTQATDILGKSLRIREAAQLAPLGGPLNNLGNIHLLQGEPGKALDAFEAALAAFDADAARRDAVIALGNVGRAKTELGDHDAALAAHRTAIERAQEHSVVDYEASGRTKLGLALLAAGDPDGAEAELSAALELADRRSGAFRDETIQALAACALAQGLHDEARGWVDELLEAAERTQQPQLKRDAHALASRVHEAAGSYREALEHLKRADAWRARLDGELFSSRTRALLLQLDVERSQRERDALRDVNAELTAAYDELSVLHETLQEQATELQRLSLEDPLTGLPNRRFLEQRLADEQARIERYGGTYSLLVCDIDDFKETNDRFSHAVGDRVLERLGSILRSTTRDVDVAARFGGEEFVVLLPATDAGQAARAGEKIRAAVNTHAWHELHPGLEITVSVGVAEAPPGATFQQVFAAADAQLYAVKRTGKNRVGRDDATSG